MNEVLTSPVHWVLSPPRQQCGSELEIIYSFATHTLPHAQGIYSTKNWIGSYQTSLMLFAMRPENLVTGLPSRRPVPPPGFDTAPIEDLESHPFSDASL